MPECPRPNSINFKKKDHFHSKNDERVTCKDLYNWHIGWGILKVASTSSTKYEFLLNYFVLDKKSAFFT